MNRRGFMRALSVVGVTSAVVPWKAIEAFDVQEMVRIGDDKVLEFDRAYGDYARRPLDEETAKRVLGEIEESLTPFVSFASIDYQGSQRGWQIVAIRWYRTQDGHEKELGVGPILRARDLRRATEAQLHSIRDVILDALARGERSRGYTWNQSTLVGWA